MSNEEQAMSYDFFLKPEHLPPCPKCGSTKIDVLSYESNRECGGTLKCLICGHNLRETGHRSCEHAARVLFVQWKEGRDE